jgi:hypothetical protein
MKRHAKKNDMAALLKNKNVLYVVLFFAVMNLFSYLMLKQLDAVAFFIIIGFLATYFSKNMIVILLTSMVSTFLLVQIKMLGSVQEVMEDATDASGNKIKAKTETETEEEPAKEDAKPVATMPAPPDAVKAEAFNGKEREKFAQPLSPARFNAADDDDVPRHKPKVDYAATLESAYDNLDKLLNSEAIRSMTEDTGRLAEKQKLLMGNIEKMTPIMEKAGNILNGFDMGAISKLMGTVGQSASKLKDIVPGIDNIKA